MNHSALFEEYKEQALQGRHITLDQLESLLEKHQSKNIITKLGCSVLGKPIYGFKTGTGNFKILLWSQMHGNEGTTTKAVFDVFNFLDSEERVAFDWKQKFTFYCIPMLNPDGAELYTRENANGVDLNRDFLNLSQPESALLLRVFEEFKPDFCFNLHDQRTIFAAGATSNPATVAFLAPAFDEPRNINPSRLKAMNLIVSINEMLQQFIPNQVGRFDDAFNRQCVGDTFQQLGVPTVLFEAGHFPEDYQREVTRKYIFFSLMEGFKVLYENDIVASKIANYLNIPQNNPCFFDFIYRNVKINYEDSEIITNFAAQFKEELFGGELVFKAYITSIGALDEYKGHLEFDAKEQPYYSATGTFPKIGELANFTLGATHEFVNGVLKK